MQGRFLTTRPCAESVAWKEELSKERDLHDNVTALNSKMIMQMERQKVLHEQVMIGIRDEKIRMEEALGREIQRFVALSHALISQSLWFVALSHGS